MENPNKPYLLDLRHVHYGKSSISKSDTIYLRSVWLTAARLPYPSELPPDSLGSTLFSTYTSLLDQVRKGISALPEDKVPKEGQKRESYNLMITTESMHIIPRTSDSFIAPRDQSEFREKKDEIDVDGGESTLYLSQVNTRQVVLMRIAE